MSEIKVAYTYLERLDPVWIPYSDTTECSWVLKSVFAMCYAECNC